jgi:hypothetical protein
MQLFSHVQASLPRRWVALIDAPLGRRVAGVRPESSDSARIVEILSRELRFITRVILAAAGRMQGMRRELMEANGRML